MPILSIKNQYIQKKVFSFLHAQFLLILILIAYLLTRMSDITILPIFNDESIYLHWGWIELNEKHNLFFSLFDGKQPMLMWIFGWFQMHISDPLIAGRIVSVLFGFLTTIGIYLISRRIGNKGIALFAAFLYVVVPIFVFYDRQALMESAVSCVGIWMFYLYIKNYPKPHVVPAVFLGLVMGVGLFIKLSVVIFALTLFILFAYQFLKQKNIFDRRQIFFTFILVLYISQIVLIPLYLQKNAFNIISMNTRYAYTINELLKFPIFQWTENTSVMFELMFWYLTPILLMLCIYGIYNALKVNNDEAKLLIIWLIMPLLIFILVTRVPSTRYIVAFLPAATIFCAYGLASIKKFQLPAISVSLVLPIILTLFLLLSPLVYFRLLEDKTRLVDSVYVKGWTSGYGIKNTVDYLIKKSNKEKITVLVRSETGNPEDALFVYLRDIKNIKVNYLPDKICNNKNKENFVRKYDMPIYFITRGEMYGNNEFCLQEEKRFYKPDGTSFIGIYQFTIDKKNK